MYAQNNIQPYGAGYVPAFNPYNTGLAGLSLQGAQEVNKALALSEIRLREHDAKQAIDFTWHQREQEGNPTTSIPAVGRPPDLAALSSSFVAEKQLVKKRSANPQFGRWRYYERDQELNRHLPCEEKMLLDEYFEYVFDHAEDPNWDNEAALKKSFSRMLHSVPRIEESGMIILKPTQVLARDCCFDLISGIFTPNPVHPSGIFNTASVPLDLLNGLDETPAFDALLRDCFAGDMLLIRRAMEMIGALISPIKVKRSIFIFQGVGNGGKTRLARLVVQHILQGYGVYIGNDFSDLADEELKKAHTPFSLVYIRDSVDKTIAPKQRSYLKSYGDSGYNANEPTYKILLCTNHAIYTGDNGHVEKPFLNRCIVLSFPKEMDMTDPMVENFEELHLEKELPSIVLNCLRAYSRVFQNKGLFSGNCQLNDVIEANTALSATIPPNDASNLGEILLRALEPINNSEPSMTTGKILEWLQSNHPELQASPETIGRALRERFGENVVSKRTSAGMCYGLRFREPSSSDMG